MPDITELFNLPAAPTQNKKPAPTPASAQVAQPNPQYPGVPAGVRVRNFFDPESTRNEIFTRVKDSFEKSFPAENDRVRIEVSDIQYPEKMSLGVRDHKKAILSGGRLAIPLKGTVSLYDKQSGQLLDQKQGTLMNVPYMTDRGSFVHGGNEYFVNNLHRLKPGVYARRKENGELESHFNIRSGTGPSMRFHMEPDTGVFRANIGQSNIKLYPILKGLGIPEEVMERHWGPDIVEANRNADDGKGFNKFYEKMFEGRKEFLPGATQFQKADHILKKLKGMEVDPEVTERTLGTAYSNVDPELILHSTGKLLKISRGQAEDDDRDALSNKTFHSVEDFMSERVARDAGKIKRQLLYKAGYDRSLKGFKPGHFTPYTQGVLIGNSLSSPGSAINMVDIMDQSFKISPMGGQEGGIADVSSLTDSARNVNASQLGVLDPIRTSESRSVGADARISSRALKGSDGNVYIPLRNRKTGQIEYLTPSQMSKKTILFPTSRSLSDFGH